MTATHYDPHGDHAVARIEIFPVQGIGEVRPGDDLAALIAERTRLQDGDVLVVTSKIVSKAEGRLVTVDPATREAARETAIDAETVRLVARRGPTRIVETRHGLVLAAAGVDASNLPASELALLPLDPDASALLLRDRIAELRGVDIGVILSDTMGRPWRNGLTDTAIGVAGLTAVTDARGRRDRYGNELGMTRVAIADEIAAAADLVKGKLSGIPVAVVRGMAPDGKLPDDGTGSRELLRSAAEDMFRMGTAEAMQVGREDAGGAAEPASQLHADAREVIGGMSPDTATDAAVRQAFLGFLAARPDAMWRSCAAGHLTASALVVDPSQQAVLLTLHPRAHMWVQLGGHCEPGDHTVLDAAAREAREESGIGSLSFDPSPLGLDVHPIICSLGVPTRHFDVRFLALAAPGAEPTRSDESLDLRWFPWDDLPPGASPELGELVAAARRRLES
jgi:coenzyme F420-0:L-glutamate ligase